MTKHQENVYQITVYSLVAFSELNQHFRDGRRYIQGTQPNYDDISFSNDKRITFEFILHLPAEGLDKGSDVDVFFF